MGPRRAAGDSTLDLEPLVEDASSASVQVADKKPLGGRWLLWLPVLVSGAILYALNIHSEVYFQGPQHGRLVAEEIPALKKVASAFLVDSPACRIPALDPWDEHVRKYVERVKPVECWRGRGPPLVASNASALFVLRDAFDAYNVTDPDDLECCYTEFYRVEDEHHPSDNNVRFEKNCTFFKSEVSVAGMEFVRVKCYNGDTMIYEDYHSFVPRKARVEERCRNASVGADADALSILVLGIDAVSRLNMHRQMPQTIRRLQQLSAIEMLGFNKVGDNTFPNLVPLLSGLSEEELKDKCWPSDSDFFDKCRFVWDDFRDAGYRTAFGEDSPWMGMFNYVKRGFSKQPTDYYTRPFLHTVEEKIGHKKPMNSKLCVGSRMTAEVLLDYVAKFSLEFNSSLSYSLFWQVSLTHDMLNYPSLSDNLHVNFLDRMERNGVLERLAILVVSDHGIRWGGIRETYQGRMEERLPILFLVLPHWFRDRYAAAVANAGRNTRRLTTHFDVHETLLDLMRPTQRLTQDAVRRRSLALTATPNKPPPRAISLFLQIPPNRSCEDAGITPHWCTCQTTLPIDNDAAIVNKTAEVLVDHINEIVRPFRQCSQLLLDTVRSVQLQVPQELLKKDTTDKGVHDYVLVVRTVPGNAIFEGTVRHKPKKDEFSVAGYVSRLNLYGTQSSCVHNHHLKLYCYCSS